MTRMRSKAFVCAAIFMILLAGGWLLNEHAYKLHFQSSTNQAHMLDAQRPAEAVSPEIRFRPREYVRIIR